MGLISNSLKSNVICILPFSIQSLLRIMSLEISLTYMVICCCPSRVLSWPSIYFLKMIFSSVVVLASASYLTKMVLSLFLRAYVFDTIVVLVPKLINPSLVTAFPSSSLIVTKRVIKVLSPSSLPFSRLSRFLTC